MSSAPPPPGIPEEYVREPAERSPGALRLKRLLQAACLPLVAHRLAALWLLSRPLGSDRAFLAASESIARIPGLRGVLCRQAFYRRTLAACGRDVYFGWSSVFSTPLAALGERVYIGRRCNIGFAEIGDRTLLADGVQILSGAHQHGSGADPGSPQGQPLVSHRVHIGADAWLGTDAIVMADVGDGSIIGAGAVVKREIPAGVVAAGVPAVVIRQRPQSPRGTVNGRERTQRNS